MIEVTIKTLDSRNHAFTVGDEFTVKQLKEHIAESVDVPADSQRLIYCGRVLVDDKKLSEYDVNGKVIHLVQRAPPSSSSDTGNSGSEPRTSSRRPFRATFFNQGSGIRVDGAAGNAMYLGAMAFPADLMDAQGARHLNNRINLPNPRHVSQSRLAVVRSFIRRARLVMQYLENPLLSTTPPEADNSPPATAQAPAPMNFAFLAQALSDAVSRAAGNLTNSDATPVINVEVLASNENGHTSDSSSEPPTQPSEEAVSGETEPTAAQMENPPLMPPLILSPPEAEASTTFPPSSADEPSNNAQESDQRPQRSRFSRPSALADLVSQAMGVHTRLQPFLDRYYELLREDAPLETPQQAQQAQHLFNSVSELLHLMAHAYHAISDVMCDFSQSPPRLLQCRPVLIHHSAVLQTGIPIQVNLGNASQSRGTATGSAEADRGSEDAESDNNGNAPDLGEAAAQAATLSAEPRLSRRDMAEVERTLNEAIRRRERSDRTPTPPREQRQARAFNISGGLEFIMDIGQGSVHIDSVEASVIPGSGAATAPSGDASGNAPSPELLNLWHALGHVTNLANRISNSPAPATTAPTTASSGSTAENNSTAPNPNNNGNANTASSSSSNSLPTAGLLPGVQAWTNTETQPTTSTQTRATTRPHVHISPGLQGIGMPGFFDPFLPCSSHHIRNQFRRSQNQSDQENSQTQTGAQRAGASTENGANATNFPSSAGVPPHNHRGIRITPDVTFVVQAPSRVSMEFPSASPLLIDMMVSSNAEGTSLYSDMFLTLARHLHVHEVRDLNFRHILTRARPHLATFFRDRLTQGRDDMEGITEGVNRFITDIRPLLDAALDSFDDIPMREDVDILASINLVNSFFLPRLVDIIINAVSDHIYYLNFRKFWMTYVHTLASIFHFCCLNGESDADNAFMRLGVRFLNAIPGLAIWAGYRVHRTVRQLLSELTPIADSVQDFIVYRMASGPVPATSEPSVATAAVTPPPMEVVPPQPVTPQPMDVEDTVVVAEQLTEELPDVILDVHPDWVPIISRDRERQRRQAVQGPLSDAYLSGMPSKRRKIVTSNKPQGSLSKIITESLSTAITAAGVPVVENVLEAVASDSSVENAYKEQLRNTLGSTAKAHPDFKPDKYPNSNKLFSSSK